MQDLIEDQWTTLNLWFIRFGTWLEYRWVAYMAMIFRRAVFFVAWMTKRQDPECWSVVKFLLRISLSIRKFKHLIFPQNKCKHFTDDSVQRAFRVACVDEMISGNKSPDYKKIINVLTESMADVSKKTGQARFEWLKEGDKLH